MKQLTLVLYLLSHNRAHRMLMRNAAGVAVEHDLSAVLDQPVMVMSEAARPNAICTHEVPFPAAAR